MQCQGAPEAGTTNLSPQSSLPIGNRAWTRQQHNDYIPGCQWRLLVCSDLGWCLYVWCNRIIHYSIKDGLCNNTIREIKEMPSAIFLFYSAWGHQQIDGKAFTPCRSSKVTHQASTGGWTPGYVVKGETNSGGLIAMMVSICINWLFQSIISLRSMLQMNQVMRGIHTMSIISIKTSRKYLVWNLQLGACAMMVRPWAGSMKPSAICARGWFIRHPAQSLRTMMENSGFGNTNYRYNIGKWIHSEGYSFLQYKREKGIEVN